MKRKEKKVYMVNRDGPKKTMDKRRALNAGGISITPRVTSRANVHLGMDDSDPVPAGVPRRQGRLSTTGQI